MNQKSVNRKNDTVYKKVHEELKKWKKEHNITEQCNVHHRDDNDEVRAYNEAKDAVVNSVNSVWQKQDPTMLLDETRSAKFVRDCLEMGLITKEEACQRLLGHPIDADAVPIDSEM